MHVLHPASNLEQCNWFLDLLPALFLAPIIGDDDHPRRVNLSPLCIALLLAGKQHARQQRHRDIAQDALKASVQQFSST